MIPNMLQGFWFRPGWDAPILGARKINQNPPVEEMKKHFKLDKIQGMSREAEYW